MLLSCARGWRRAKKFASLSDSPRRGGGGSVLVAIKLCHAFFLTGSVLTSCLLSPDFPPLLNTRAAEGEAS